MTDTATPPERAPQPPLPPLVPLALPKEVADYLGVSTKTLAAWRRSGRGPAYIQIGQVRYQWVDVIAWQDEQAKP